jgi:hypothetical protein
VDQVVAVTAVQVGLREQQAVLVIKAAILQPKVNQVANQAALELIVAVVAVVLLRQVKQVELDQI